MKNIQGIDNTDEKLGIPSLVACWKKVWDKKGWLAWDAYRHIKVRMNFSIRREISRKIHELDSKHNEDN